MDYNQKRVRCGKYIEALEEERRKIHVFQRELPLCLDLVTQGMYKYLNIQRNVLIYIYLLHEMQDLWSIFFSQKKKKTIRVKF